MSLRVEIGKDLERKFRELAMKKYGYSKGAIKKATETALKKWAEEVRAEREEKKEDINAHALKLLQKGFNLGGIAYRKRAELHERKWYS